MESYSRTIEVKENGRGLTKNHREIKENHGLKVNHRELKDNHEKGQENHKEIKEKLREVGDEGDIPIYGHDKTKPSLWRKCVVSL